jgi:hypothetical protein
MVLIAKLKNLGLNVVFYAFKLSYSGGRDTESWFEGSPDKNLRPYLKNKPKANVLGCGSCGIELP